MNILNVTLDLSKDRKRPNQTVTIGQGDQGGTTIVARVLDNGTAASLTGATAAFVMRAPGGGSYVRDTNCTVSGNLITYVADEGHIAARSGYTDEAYFQIDLNGRRYSTDRFRIKVIRSALDGATPAPDWDTSIDDIIERGEDAIDALVSPVASVSKSGTTSTLTVTDARGTTEVEICDGATGATGPAGASATIEEVTATVDSSTGTPSVDVTLGGTSLARTIAMVFHNLKGAKGDPGTVTPVTTSQIDDVVADTSVTSDNALTGTGLTYLWGKLKAAFAAATHSHSAGDVTSGTLGVARGGTGKDTHTANAVLTGNGASAVGNVATADGAFYATAANGAAQFGTLPVAQGGTGASTAASARTNLGTPTSSSLATVEQSTATASHAKDSHFMLDGELRKATSAIATGESITSSNSMADTLQGQIDTLRDSVSLLWTNPNPSASFAAQTVMFDRSGAAYDLFLVVFKGYSTSNRESSTLVRKGLLSEIYAISGNNGFATSEIYVVIRSIETSGDTSMSFGEGRKASSVSIYEKDNSVSRPLKIYGIRVS